MDARRFATALLLVASILRAGTTTTAWCDVADDFQILTDATHPWRPPFGLDRVGRPLTVEIESRAKTRPSPGFVLAGYCDGRVVARQQVDFADSAPFVGRVTFDRWPQEVRLSRITEDGPLEVARQKIDVPSVEADAMAAPESATNPVDLGTVLVPADHLLLEAGQSGYVDVAAISRTQDIPTASIEVWFVSAPNRKVSCTVSLEKDCRKQFRLPLPRPATQQTRDVLNVSLRAGAEELWHKTIPTMVVSARPNWPRFGASQTKLRYDAPILIRRDDGTVDQLAYEKGWDDDLQDVVVSLPNGSRFVFWRGSSYVPFWAGTNNTGFTYEWAETMPPSDGFVDAVEPLMDKELRYGRVEIIESTESKIHVRWKYQSCDFNYKVWGDSAVEDFYFYPDSYGTRVVTLTSTPRREYELIEFIVLTPQSTYPWSVLPRNLVDVLFLDGQKRAMQFPFLEPPESENRRSRDVPAVWRIRIHKDEQQTPISFSPRETHQPHHVYGPFGDRRQQVTPVYWGSHWPLTRGKTTGGRIDDGIHSSPAHNSIMTWGYNLRPEPIESRAVDTVDTLGRKRPMHVQKFVWMIGKTADSDARLLERARSYAQPPEVAVAGGAYEGWKADRRAHQIAVEQSTVTIRFKPQVPCVDPAIDLTNVKGRLQTIRLDGRLLPQEDYTWDGQTLWLAADITCQTTLQVTFDRP